MKEKQKCPICQKGLLEKSTDEISKGIHVDCLKCNICNEIFYSEEVMEKIEAMKKITAKQ